MNERNTPTSRFWTKEEDEALRLMWASDLSTDAIAAELGRSIKSVWTRRRRLGLPQRIGRPVLRSSLTEVAEVIAPPLDRTAAEESAKRRIAERRAENDRRTRAAHIHSISAGAHR